MIPILVNVDEEMKAWLDQTRLESGVPMNELVRRAIAAERGRLTHPSNGLPLTGSTVESSPVPTPSVSHLGPRPRLVPDVSSSSEVSAGCEHKASKPSVGSLRRCQDCGATRGLDGVWR
jgi:hypothetical protein